MYEKIILNCWIKNLEKQDVSKITLYVIEKSIFY